MTLYPGIAFSPQAALTNNIGAADTIIEVSDVSAFPSAPNLATIGTDEEAETIFYAAKTGTALSGCVRGVEGTAKSWSAGEPIARNWTAKDHADLIAALEAHQALFSAKQDKLTGQPGQVVGFDADGAAQAVQGWSSPNILINADFRRPVNRLGKQVYDCSNGTVWAYTPVFDMATQCLSTVTIHDGYINLKNSATKKNYRGLYLKVPNPSVYLNKQCTLSVLCKVYEARLSELGGLRSYATTTNIISGGCQIWVENTPPPLNQIILLSATGTPGLTEDGKSFNNVVFQSNNSASSALDMDIYAVKLELGDHQTLAHQDADGNWVLNDPVDYEAEYAKCAQYDPQTGEWVGYAQPVNDAANLALQSACPTNRILYDNAGKGGTYVYIPKFRLCDVLSTTDTSTHPAFIVNGEEIDGFYMGKFQSSADGGRAYSLPAKDPTANVTLDTVISQNRAKGGDFHEVTAAEWAAIALWCHKNGTEPKGNNNYGKDVSETLYKAVPSCARDSSGRIQRVATGTGPVTWSHDGTLEGVWDLNGNVWEWCAGMRLIHGELQVIPYNDAADPTCDLSSTSAAWKAIKAAATSWDDLFVTPDGNGTTQGTVKLDLVNSKWTYSTTIAHTTTATGCSFKDVSCDASIGAHAKLLLQALAMMPDTALTGDDIAADYNMDHFYINSAEAERCLVRGGRWGNGAYAGVFDSSLGSPRSASNGDLGGRSASYRPNEIF